MLERTRFTAVLCAMLLVAGCSSTPDVDQHQLSARTDSVIDGQAVALDTRIRQQVWKDGGVYATGQRPQPGQTLTRDYDSTRALSANLLVQDAEIGLGTRRLLQRFEPTLERALRSAGARPTGDADAPYRLSAELTFGPTPAPAYAAYDLGKSLGVSVMTLGLGPKQYALRSDYRLTLRLTDTATGQVISKRDYVADKAYPQSRHALDLGAGERTITAAAGLFEDSLEGQLSDFLRRLP